MKLDHIGIAVKKLEISDKLFSKLLNRVPFKTETIVSESVKTSFYHTGESKIELLEPTNEDSPIAKFLNKKGEGIHHIAFEVDNIEKEINRLEKEGFSFVGEKIRIGNNQKRIAFLHPKQSNGVLIELCEKK